MKMSLMDAAKRVATLTAKTEMNALKKQIMGGGSGAYARGYNFMVAIDDNLYPFMKVDGLETSTEMQYYIEGGNNLRNVPLRGSKAGQHVLTLSYGAGKKSTALNTLDAGKFLEKGVTIVVLGEKLKSTQVSLYELEGCYIKSINFGGLDSMRSEIMINSLEIVYSSVKVFEDLA